MELIADTQPFPHGQCLEFLCDGTIRSPGEAYGLYVAELERRKLPAGEYYFSTTITSGGYMRDPDLSFAEALDANNDFAKRYANAIVEHYGLNPETVVLPTELGKVAGWSQADYLLFWFHVINNAQPADALAIDPHLSAESFTAITTVMEDKPLPKRLRESAYTEYLSFERVLAETPEGQTYTRNSGDTMRLVPILDDEFSLGCLTEKRLGGWQRPKLTAVIPPDLARESEHLMKLGAYVFGRTYDPTAAEEWRLYFLPIAEFYAQRGHLP